MIKSMTGFGRGESGDGKRIATVEVRSVNHRYNDINVKMSRKYVFAEDTVRKLAKKRIRRGKVDISVNIENLEESDVSINVNSDLAKQYLDKLDALRKDLKMSAGFFSGDSVTLEYVASLPEVIRIVPDVESEEEIIALIEKACAEALDAHSAMRETEGEKLAADLLKRGRIILDALESIKERTPDMQREYTEKLKERIAELTEDKIDVPDDRILLEAAIFADKSNVTEEVVRLRSHVSQMEDILRSEKAEGKKLDFLVQEMNREANTIGSKANDLEITSTVLDIKGEVEKIREQVQNIE
jgi:uncharacterized protein (TIGR00255 family)